MSGVFHDTYVPEDEQATPPPASPSEPVASEATQPEELPTGTVSAQVSQEAVATVVDPKALPSNVNQLKEAFDRQMAEYVGTPAYRSGVFPVAEDDERYPSVFKEQQRLAALPLEPELIRPTPPVVTKRTQDEMEAGRKSVAAAKAATEDREAVRTQRELENKQLLAAKGTPGTGDQIEAKFKEAVRRVQTWGEGEQRAQTMLEHPMRVYKEDMPYALSPEKRAEEAA